MDKCPICFEHINTEDLIYEVLFHADREGIPVTPDHSWIRDTRLGMFFDSHSPAFCIHYVRDNKTGEVFGRAGAQTNRYLMLSRRELRARRQDYSRSDIQVFLKGMKAILNDQGNADEGNDDSFINGSIDGNSFFGMETDRESAAVASDEEDFFDGAFQGEPLFSDEESVFSGSELSDLSSIYEIQGDHDVENYMYTVKVDRCMAFQIVPCCPHCRVHLPKGWKSADSYVPIGFVSPRTGGKTTIIEALVSEQFWQFNQLGSDLYAYSGQDEEFSRYYREEIVKKAEELVKNKKYPDASEIFDRPPVFMILEYKYHKILIGLFDIAGETLEALKVDNPLADYLVHMEGIVCLVDPNCLRMKLRPDITYIYEGVENPNPEERQEKKKFAIRSIEEQGRLQRNSREIITIEELLKETASGNTQENSVMYNGANYKLTRDTFMRLINVAARKSGVGRAVFRNAHLAMTIMKSDELRNTPEIQSLSSGDREAIFETPYSLDAYLNPDMRHTRNTVIPRLFDQYFFHAEQGYKDKETFVQFFGSVSWHCISAVGCDKTIVKYFPGGKGESYYDGEFKPIRVIEPILEIVFRHLGEIR